MGEKAKSVLKGDMLLGELKVEGEARSGVFPGVRAANADHQRFSTAMKLSMRLFITCIDATLLGFHGIVGTTMSVKDKVVTQDSGVT